MSGSKIAGPGPFSPGFSPAFGSGRAVGTGVPPAFGDVDYQQAMVRLLPSGRAWRTDLGAKLSAFLLALAPTYRRSTEAAAQLIVDARPDTTQNLLPEWESSLGLPDQCSLPNPSMLQRAAAVRMKWGARGSLSIPYFISLATALGFTITITEFRTFAAGMPCGSPDCGPAWAFAWQVNALQGFTFHFQAGHSAAGDPLTSYDATELVCRITANRPAETTVFFTFS
jgi:uncharacterized protein YmfQ (DUF2313 family)